MPRLGLYLGLGLFLSGCFSSRQELPEIILSYNDPVVQVKFSELVDSLEIIHLETNDSILIPASFQLCLGEKYMVMEYSGAIHQFSRDGKYIRKMLNKGRGPEEYLWCASQGIEEGEGKYFMTDNLGNLWAYDLEEGKSLGKSSLPFNMKILKITGDTIICMPDFSSAGFTSPYLWCAVNQKGEILDYFTDTIVNGSMFSLNVQLALEGQIRFKKGWSDTVYTIHVGQKMPAFVLKEKYIDHRIKPIVLLGPEIAGYYYFTTAPVTVEYDEKGKISAVSVLSSPKNFRVNKKNHRSEIVDKIYIDTLGIGIPFASFHMGQKKCSFSLSSFRLKEALKNRAAKVPLSAELEKLYRKVKEDDNPLIFIGRNKLSGSYNL